MQWSRMVNNPPTESVSGADDWEWNQWQSEVRGRGTRPETAERPSAGYGSTTGTQHAREQVIALQRENRELKVEIGRTEDRLQDVVTRYERLLRERERTIQGRRTDTRSECLLARLRRTVSRLLPV